MAEVKQNDPTTVVSAQTLLTPRYLILQQLAENSPLQSKIIAQNLSKYGVGKEKILIELNKLKKSKRKLVGRVKSSINRRYLYSITENGLEELNHRNKLVEDRQKIGVQDSVLNTYSWLLEELQEPRTIEDLEELRGDSDKTLSVYLSYLFKAGLINRYKVSEGRKITQRNRKGKEITRNTTIKKTYYKINTGNTEDKMKVPTSEKATGPSLKNPIFTSEEEIKFEKWFGLVKGKEYEPYHKAIRSHANKHKVEPLVVYRIAFRDQLKRGKIQRR